MATILTRARQQQLHSEANQQRSQSVVVLTFGSSSPRFQVVDSHTNPDVDPTLENVADGRDNVDNDFRDALETLRRDVDFQGGPDGADDPDGPPGDPDRGSNDGNDNVHSQGTPSVGSSTTGIFSVGTSDQQFLGAIQALANSIQTNARNQSIPPPPPVICPDRIQAKAPDNFDGSKPEKLREFLFQCCLYFSTNPHQFSNDHTKVSYALSYLSGSVHQWFRTMIVKYQTKGDGH